jgi:methylenetetrahydrofolate dehydrogenase (NADP+)/methenyltetrahydrofolate cyclohydrolase
MLRAPAFLTERAMAATIMDGKRVSAEIRALVGEEVRRLEGKGLRPCLATILVGSDEASRLYVSLKHKACLEVGIRSLNCHFPEATAEDRIAAKINELNRDDAIHGIMVELPLPPPLEAQGVMGRISPVKDVDGLTPSNLGQAMYRGHGLLPCTPAGIMVLLSRYSVEVEGRYAVIVNRSPDVGKPLALMLLNRDATVTVCHSKTEDIEYHTRRADILISAVGGRPQFLIREDMVKPGAAVIDVGMNRVEGRLCGDVDLEGLRHRASYIAPVPGGVGPMTIAMLLRNTLAAAMAQAGMELRGPLAFDREISGPT